jgi:hypothetical protein
MVISKQDLIGLPIDAAPCDASHQIAFHLLNQVFREHDSAVGIEEGIRVTQEPAVTGTGGEPVHDLPDLSLIDIVEKFDLKR